ERAKGEPRFTSREQIGQFQRIVAWSGRTRMGDLAEVEALPDDSPLLPLVTSTADNCLGSECPMWNECFVVQARQRAQSADLVVVNHHLLLADLALKQEGFGEILPGAQAFVVDEAHQLPELAAQFFGESLSARPLVELARDALGECKNQPGALAVLQQPVRELEHATRALRATMEGLPNRGTRDRALHWPAFDSGLEAVSAAVATLRDALAPLRDSSPGFDACHARAQENASRLARWAGAKPGSESTFPVDGSAVEAGRKVDPDPGCSADVRWYELSPRGFRLQRTPLDVSGPLRTHREQSNAAWVFTSATLAVDGSFGHLATRLGLEDPETLLVPSPFDWPAQALCYLPTRMPQPADRDYTWAVVEAIRPVLQASGGRAFVLFAS